MDPNKVSLTSPVPGSTGTEFEGETDLFETLKAGDFEFVEDNRELIPEFVTIPNLKRLYRSLLVGDKQQYSTSNILHHLEQKAKDIQCLHGICQIPRCSCKCQLCDNSVQDVDGPMLEEVGRLIQLLLHYKCHNWFKTMEKGHRNQSQMGSGTDIMEMGNGSGRMGSIVEPYKELFIWAVLADHRSLARSLLQMCSDPIGASVFACCMLRTIAENTVFQEDMDFKRDIKQEIWYYESFACGILSSCYKIDKAMSHDLLTRELDNWGMTTVISLAESSRLMKFMRLPCCQTKLNRIWFGRMAEYTHIWKIIVNILFLPLVPLFLFVIRYRKPGHKPEPENTPREDLTVSISGIIAACNTCSEEPCAKKKKRISYLDAWIEFYTAPVTKFYLHGIFYIMFLILFTFVILSHRPILREQGRPFNTTVEEIRRNKVVVSAEIFLWLWAIVLFLETIRQIVQEETTLYLYKFLNHFHRFWNLVDLIMFGLFIASIALRINSEDDTSGQPSRATYALALVFAFIKYMKAAYVFRAIGPKVIMIRKMLKDLWFFLIILSVFICGFGIAIQSLLHPGQGFSPGSLVNSVYTPYWQIFGELFIERAEGVCDNDTASRLHIDYKAEDCSGPSWLVPALTAVYMLLSNVLLLNLLIAMFSYTFQKVQDKSELVWKFYRYQAVHDYYRSPAFPGPLLIISFILNGYKICKRKVGDNLPPVSAFRQRLSAEENAKLSIFEVEGMEKYLEDGADEGLKRYEYDDSDDDLDDDNSSTSDSYKRNSVIQNLSQKVQCLEEKLDKQFELLNKLVKKSNTSSSAQV